MTNRRCVTQLLLHTMLASAFACAAGCASSTHRSSNEDQVPSLSATSAASSGALRQLDTDLADACRAFERQLPTAAHPSRSDLSAFAAAVQTAASRLRDVPASVWEQAGRPALRQEVDRYLSLAAREFRAASEGNGLPKTVIRRRRSLAYNIYIHRLDGLPRAVRRCGTLFMP
jgi:hypothetical protein